MDTSGEILNLSFQLIFGIVGMILLTVFIIIFFIIYQRRLLQQQLEAQQMEAAYQKELLNTGILAQEAERERIAIELHDSIGGLLSATKIYISNIGKELSTEQFQLFKSKAIETLNENIGEVRTITNDLLPQSLERLGVVAASRNLMEKLTELKDININFNTNMEDRFEPNREKALFRILQELVNNTLKHSTAQNVSLFFHFYPEHLSVSYEEDGQGFDRQAYEKRNNLKSFGLKSIESRMAFLNGKLDYNTALGEGICVELNLPIYHK